MKFNKKYTTIAIYACLVILFAIVCVYFLMAIDKDRYSDFFSKLSGIFARIFVGIIIAYILNPIMNFFENWVFVNHNLRKSVLDECKQKHKEGEKVGFMQTIDMASERSCDYVKEQYDKKVIEYEKNPTKKLPGGKTIKKKKPKFKEHPRRGISLLCTYLVFIALISLMLWALIPQIGSTINSLIDLIKKFISVQIPQIETYLYNHETFGPILEQYDISFDISKRLTDILNLVTSELSSISANLLTFITSIYNTVYSAVIGIIFSIYFLASKELLLSQFKGVLENLFPNGVVFWVKFIIKDIDDKFGKFVEGKIVDSAIIGVLSCIIFYIFDIPYAAMIAIIVGITNIIPFFGPFIGAIPSALIILIADPSKVILFIILIVIIQQLDGNLIGPFVLGDSLNMPPVWIMISIIVMGGLFGIVGMFFGVPIFAVIFTIIKELEVRSRAKKEAKAKMAKQRDIDLDTD